VPTPPPPEHSRWKPGQSGNPQGHSKGRRATSELLKLIEEKGADRAIATKWLQMILDGDFRYMKEYIDRVEGKVPIAIQNEDAPQRVRRIGGPRPGADGDGPPGEVLGDDGEV
jgi:hypothetical protein